LQCNHRYRRCTTDESGVACCSLVSEDHRREHRLALLEQAQNASSRREHIDLGRLPMTMWQTRRRFLTMAALAGAAGILPPQRAWAAEPALETTTVRPAREPVICLGPAICLRGVAARRGVY